MGKELRAIPKPNQGTEGRHWVKLQDDGNLVHYSNEGWSDPVNWASNTHGRGTGPYRLVMESNNKLVLYDSTNADLWSSTTYGGKAGGLAKIDNSGNFATYDGDGTQLWKADNKYEGQWCPACGR